MPVLRRWNGAEWTAVGAEENIDTSALVTLDTDQTITGDKTFEELSVIRGLETLAPVLTDSAGPLRISAGPRAEAPLNPSLDDVWIITDEGTSSADAGVAGWISPEIDYAERAAVYDILAVGRVYTDIEGLFVSVPAQTSPYYIEFGGVVHFATGTSANGSLLTVFFAAQEETSGVAYGYTAVTEKQVGTTSALSQHPVHFARRIMPHTEDRVYRLRTRIDLAAPAGWATAQLLATDVPTQGFWPPAYFKAVKA